MLYAHVHGIVALYQACKSISSISLCLQAYISRRKLMILQERHGRYSFGSEPRRYDVGARCLDVADLRDLHGCSPDPVLDGNRDANRHLNPTPHGRSLPMLHPPGLSICALQILLQAKRLRLAYCRPRNYNADTRAAGPGGFCSAKEEVI